MRAPTQVDEIEGFSKLPLSDGFSMLPSAKAVIDRAATSTSDANSFLMVSPNEVFIKRGKYITVHGLGYGNGQSIQGSGVVRTNPN